MKKFIAALISLLFILIVVEVSFYVGLSQTQQCPAKKQSTACTPQPPRPTLPAINKDPAINSEVIEMWKDAGHDKNISVSMRVQTKGKITSIQRGKTYKGIFFPFSMSVSTDLTHAKAPRLYMYPESLLKQVTVYEKKNGKDSKIKLDDLNIGDTVLLDEYYDPYINPEKPEQVISYSIYKI